jgi:DNA-binding SARP family transcriptional activator
MTVSYRLLGPVGASAAGGDLRLGGPKQRALLALLLVHANEVVSDDRLIDELWGEDPPARARNTVQVYVSQLRKALGPSLRRAGSGYVIDADAEQLDTVRFEQLLLAGQAALAAGRPQDAAATLRQALELWLGAPLGGVGDEQFASIERGRLDQLRATAVEARIDADLALGRHGDLIGELETLVAEHPLRERFRGQLMLACYRSGRQADALEAYRAARETLVEELGIEPGRELQELERAILVQDEALEAPAAPAAPEEAREVRKTVSVISLALGDGNGDPEAGRHAAATAAELVEAVAGRHGGRVERSPDGTTVVFGLPAVHEDDPVRAVRAAAELRDAFAAAAIGVATGDVLAHDSVVVAGDTAARALRLAAHARPGEALVDGATRALSRNAVDAEELRRPAGAWRLLAVEPDAPGYARREDADLLGRDAELAELRHAFERTQRAKQAHLFTLLGPAGIGKSRLLRELAGRLGDEALVLHGRCLAYGEGVTFWPLAEVVRQVLPDPTTESIRSLVADEPEADAVAERLAGAIGLADVKAGADAIFWATRKLFERLAADRPLVVVFDDVHWAEQTFLDLIEHVVDWARTAPILVVCLARPEFLEERARWGASSGFSTTLMLGPLSDGESRALVDSHFAERPLPPEMRERIVAVAEGNPLYIEQLGALLADEHADADTVIPPTIQALLAARLDRLPAAERDALERAAVVGRDFWPAAVAELQPDRPREATDAALNALVRKLLVAPGGSRFRGEEALRFQHQLIREVAYGSVPKELRAELHESFAGWLERQAEVVAEVQELLGYHLEQAYRFRTELGLGGWDTVGERARDHLFAAGRRAVSRGDVPAAIGLLTRAAEITPQEDPVRADVLTELAEAMRESGDFADADIMLADALAAAADRHDRAAEAHARLARLRVQMATSHELASEEIEDVVDAAIGVLDELGDERRLAKAWFLRAWLAWLGCRAMEAAEASRRSAEYARRAGDERGQAQALHLLVGADLFGPTPVREALARCEEVMAALPAQRRVAASALRAMAGLTAMDGEFGLSLELLGRDRAILDDLGLRVAAAGASEIAGLVHMLAGDPETAEQELRRGYDSFERMGERANLSTLAAMLAQALYAQGRDDEAFELTRVSEEAAARDDLHTQVQWRGARAKLLARSGHGEQAEALAREAVDLADRTDFLVMKGNAALDLAEVLLLDGREADAKAPGKAALDLYGRKGATASAVQAERVLASSSGRRSRSSSPPSSASGSPDDGEARGSR